MLGEALAAIHATPIRRPYRETGWSIVFEREPGADFTHLTIAARRLERVDDRVLALRAGVAALRADQLRTVSISAPPELAKTFAAMFRGQRGAHISFP